MGTCLPSRDLPRYGALHRQRQVPVNRLMSGTLKLDEIEHDFDLLQKVNAIH